MDTALETKEFMPASHVESLGKIEDGYWWYIGRVESAVDLIDTWRKGGRWRAESGPIENYIDIGCGTGGFADAMRKRYSPRRSLLIDGDRRVLDLPARYAGIEVACLDFSGEFSLPFMPQLVTCMDVIEHLEDDQKFLNRLFRQMPSQSALVLSVPAHQALFSEWDRQLGHFRRYGRGELRVKLLAAGFTIRDLKYSWSFLAPIAPYRKFRSARYKKNMEFEKAPAWANSLLVALSRVERTISKIISPPFGTSLLALAVKP